jgi:hypothetical protein
MVEPQVPDDGRRDLLRHFLAVLAYRTQKALRGAPPEFLDFQAGQGVRTPRELLDHMSSLMTFTASRFTGGDIGLETDDPVERFHEGLGVVSAALKQVALEPDTAHRLLQGPLADAMTHVGQLAMLRRLATSPVPGESFFEADISPENTGPRQPVQGA